MARVKDQGAQVDGDPTELASSTPYRTPAFIDHGSPLDAIVESVTDPYVIGNPVRDAGGLIVDFVVVAANHAATTVVGLRHRAFVGQRASALF